MAVATQQPFHCCIAGTRGPRKSWKGLECFHTARIPPQCKVCIGFLEAPMQNKLAIVKQIGKCPCPPCIQAFCTKNMESSNNDSSFFGTGGREHHGGHNTPRTWIPNRRISWPSHDSSSLGNASCCLLRSRHLALAEGAARSSASNRITTRDLKIISNFCYLKS